MHIHAGFRIAFDCDQPTLLLPMLTVRPEHRAELVTPDTLIVDPPLPVRRYKDQFGNICSRMVAQPGRTTLSADFLIRDSGKPDPVCRQAIQHPVADLPDDVFVYLLPSRYCEVDKLSDLAWSLFGAVEAGWDRVQAIVDYTHRRLTFGYPFARPTRTAAEAHAEQVGVCRDFAHLAITLCRCMNIPARYCTGYLGDIGIPAMDAPMDFSAWIQVYLGGAWRTFDARHNVPRIGRIVQAVGRDATDVAITTAFGQARLAEFEVFTDEVEAPPARLDSRRGAGLAPGANRWAAAPA